MHRTKTVIKYTLDVWSKARKRWVSATDELFDDYNEAAEYESWYVIYFGPIYPPVDPAAPIPMPPRTRIREVAVTGTRSHTHPGRLTTDVRRAAGPSGQKYRGTIGGRRCD